MTIGIDIRVLGSGRRTGIEEYTEQLLAHMFSLDPSVRFKLFFNAFQKQVPHYPWMDLPNVTTHSYKLPNKLFSAGARLLNYSYVDKLLGGTDVFFSPHFLPVGLSPQTKRVTTFHDLSFERFPEFFSWPKRLWHQIAQPKWQARFSDCLIAVSDSTKQDIASLYHIDPARITTIYSGVSQDMKRPDEESLRKFKVDKRLPDRFILFLGTLEPRKNILGLLKAFQKLQEIYSGDVHLVLVGNRGWLYEDIFKMIERSHYRTHIRHIEHVEDHERAYYYSLASLFVYPSFFEGFGFPPLEAMTCGTPVIVSDTSSLPEVVGSGGLLVDPYDISALAFSMRDMLSQPKLREHFMTQGLKRISQFSWQKTAQETLSLLTSFS